MVLLELIGVLAILAVIWLLGWIPGYKVGYRDGKLGKPTNWAKMRDKPSAVSDE